jgi:hypothetical protein
MLQSELTICGVDSMPAVYPAAVSATPIIARGGDRYFKGEVAQRHEEGHGLLAVTMKAVLAQSMYSEFLNAFWKLKITMPILTETRKNMPVA